ncbi:MAG TPA: sugar phosphate nucleotidyltransferase [Patescibacteria group bacterium]
MANNKKVRKAIIPAAGFGTRFLPATKAQPKEMLPIVDKPVIQYVVEDAVSAGIEDIIIVTGWSKRNIEDHFDYPYELEKRLQESGKTKELEQIRQIANLANFTYLRQKGPLGNGTAILNAKHLIGNEPFMVLWGDDFMDATPTRAQQLVAAFGELNPSAVLTAIRANKEEDYKRYAFATGSKDKEDLMRIKEIVEKPGRNIGSDFGIVGGAIYGPEMLEALDEAYKRWQKESKGEFLYIDGLNILLENNKECYALEIKNAKWYDCGDKLEYLKAVVEFGLKHKDLNVEFAKYLKNIV